MRSTVGCVWPPQIRLLTGRPVETARDPPAEVCVARTCREAGAREKENQLLRDLNTVVPVTDQRRIEVIANGLPFWGGKQLAVYTTVVSALSGRGVARGRWDGQAIHEAQLVDGSRCHLLVMAFGWQDGGATKESRSSNHWLGTSPCRCRGFCADPPNCCSSNAGQPCWRAPYSGHTQRSCWGSHWAPAVA